MMNMIHVERNDNVPLNENESVNKNGISMTKYQAEHLAGERDIYKPVEAYAEDWEHITDKNNKFIRAYPKPGTRRRQDLPSIAEQWRVDAKSRQRVIRRLENESSASDR